METKYANNITELEKRRDTLIKEIELYNTKCRELKGLVMIEGAINMYDIPRPIYY